MRRGSKYQAIGEYLANRKQERVRLTYKEIAGLCPLPAIAYVDRPFWANTWRSNHAQAWLQAGYVVDEVSLGNFVVFQHDPDRAKEPGKGRRNGIGGKKPKQSVKPSKATYVSADLPKLPRPCPNEVEKYLGQWNELEGYSEQEAALDDLFSKHCPQNKSLSDILLKVAALNTFYSTNIFSVTPVARHILKLDIDARLKAEDLTLVDDLQTVKLKDKTRHFYSFATKYCSHHNPAAFPIYDSYVDKVLRYFRTVDAFADFCNDDLKHYARFREILGEFQHFYGLEEYSVKEIDKYLWQLGKTFLPNKYN